MYQIAQEKKKVEHKEKDQQERDERIKQFYEKTMGESNDLNDQMQELADFLKHFTKATAVYIGKLVSPKKHINEQDDDQAHIDADAAQIIHYLKATENHQYLVDQILKQDQGLTFDVFKDLENASETKETEENEEDGDSKAKP